MVGQPKNLSDLNRIEADVRITCRRCRHEVDWTVADLTAHLRTIGGSTVWSEITRYLVCRRQGCGSHDLRALPVPYARRQPNLPRRISRLDAQLVGTAMKILGEAVSSAPGRNVATIEVRLALLVVHAYLRDRDVVRQFWERAGRGGRSVSEGLHQPLELIRQAMERAGWLARPEVPERVSVWPWATPAPPGWGVARDGRREGSNDE